MYETIKPANLIVSIGPTTSESSLLIFGCPWSQQEGTVACAASLRCFVLLRQEAAGLATENAASAGWKLSARRVITTTNERHICVWVRQAASDEDAT